MSDWREVTLGELIEIAHGFAFKGEYFTEGGEMSVVTPGNFVEAGGFRDRGVKQKSYDGPVPEEYILDPGEVVIAMTEQAPGLLGSSGLVPRSGRWLHNQRIGRVRFRDELTSKRFVYYLFNAPAVRAQISSTATGTKVRHTAPERVLAVKAIVPDPPTQARIAAVLSALDRLIEINERRMELLEELVRSLYREWFVQVRFPDHSQLPMTISEHGEIPEGWLAGTVDDFFEVIGGGTPSKREPSYWEGGTIDWYTPSDLTRTKDRFAHEAADRITELGLQKSSARRFPAGSVLMTSRATLGVLAIATSSAACNQGFIVVPPSDGVPSTFIYEWLASHRAQLESIATGATFKEITKGAFKRVPFIKPSGAVLRAFADMTAPVEHEIATLELSNRALARTRDLLLPRLVTGRIDISDIDLDDLLSGEHPQ